MGNSPLILSRRTCPRSSNTLASPCPHNIWEKNKNKQKNKCQNLLSNNLLLILMYIEETYKIHKIYFLFYPTGKQQKFNTLCKNLKSPWTFTNTQRFYCKLVQFLITLHPRNKHLISGSWLLLAEHSIWIK